MMSCCANYHAFAAKWLYLVIGLPHCSKDIQRWQTLILNVALGVTSEKESFPDFTSTGVAFVIATPSFITPNIQIVAQSCHSLRARTSVET
jgi:hypothetical protein